MRGERRFNTGKRRLGEFECLIRGGKKNLSPDEKKKKKKKLARHKHGNQKKTKNTTTMEGSNNK